MPRPALPIATAGLIGAEALVGACVALGVRHAFVVSGQGEHGWTEVHDALVAADVKTLAIGEPAVAVYAAIEASVASAEPLLVVGGGRQRPGGLAESLGDAEASGAKVLLMSVRPQGGGRGAEAAGHLPGSAVRTFPVDSVSDVAPVVARLQRGLLGRAPYLAVLDVAAAVLREEADPPSRPPRWHLLAPAVDPAAVDEVRSMLATGRVAIWVGEAARDAAPQVRAVVRRTGCPTFATPGGKGVLPEDHEAYLGVSSQAGHRSLADALASYGPDRLLVLGTQVGEIDPSDEALIPAGGIVHVHPDPSVNAPFFDGAPVLAVEADVAGFLDAVLAGAIQPGPGPKFGPRPPFPADLPPVPTPPCWVRPEILMSTLQRVVVDGSNAHLFVDGASAAALATRLLRLREPRRLRIPGRNAPAGQLAIGAVGAAAASGDRVVCIVEGASRLLAGQAAVAAEHGLAVSWVVLDGGGPGSSHVDPVELARAMGVPAVAVEREAFLAAALHRSVTSDGPSVVGVVVEGSASRVARRRAG